MTFKDGHALKYFLLKKSIVYYHLKKINTFAIFFYLGSLQLIGKYKNKISIILFGRMPEKFTFPSIDQAMSLQSAQNMEQIKVSLRNWFNQNNSLKLSENVAWSFKLLNSEYLLRRYIHCKFCHAKLIFVKQTTAKDNKSNAFKLVRFNIHHDHRFIESVKQKGKMKTFPQNYPKLPNYDRHSVKKQRLKRTQKLRKKRAEINKYKKLELYYRLNMSVKSCDKNIINIKEFAAKSLGISQQRFMNFLNSTTRGVVQVSGIKNLLKRAGFQKYNIDFDGMSNLKYKKSNAQDSGQQNEINSQQQEAEDKSKKKNATLTIDESKQYFKELMIFVNYNQSSKQNLQKSQGLINITHMDSKIISKKFMNNMKWEILLLYSHDLNFIPNQLYAIIMIQSSRFNIRQIKKCFEITFKLLNPQKRINFSCCIHQQNIYIMGALDIIIEENNQKNCLYSNKQSSKLFLSYFLSPKLSQSIINKCEFIPKIFRKRLIDKIYELDPKQIDAQYQRIVTQLQKASHIKEYKTKTEEYLMQLREFYENFHKIFLGKFSNPTFVSLIFTNFKTHQNMFETSMDQLLQEILLKYSQGNKYFFQVIILIFEVFQLPGGSFIYKKHQGQTRQTTKVQEIYANYLIMPEYQIFDSIKKIYNSKTFKGKYYKPQGAQKQKINSDFYQQFSALIYERVYKIKEIFMKLTPQVMAILIKQIQKSFTLQIQTRTIQQIKKQGIIKAKQISKPPNTIKILNLEKFWSLQYQKKSKQNQVQNQINLISLQQSVIQLDQASNKKSNINKQRQMKKNKSKKLWQCDCNWSKLTYLPCCHQIRCCLTFFTSLQDQIDDYWLFDPKTLQLLQDENKSDILTQDENNNKQIQQQQKQNNSQSD